MKFLLSEVAEATSGRFVGDDREIQGVSIDSRSVLPGQLFVPIVAERNGHDFIAAAIENGAAAHLASELPTAVDAPLVEVDDTAVALQDLGREARARLTGNVIGVTGSVGKTTTKDLLTAALSRSQRTHSSLRSFNNELGVPLTLVNAPIDAESLIVELGARGPGHITLLTDMARPNIGVVLTVGAAHTEMFGDLDAVADAKGELISALPPSGTAILNADDPRVLAMADRTEADILTFGSGGAVSAQGVELDDALRPRFTLTSPWGSTELMLPSAGLHTVLNGVAAAAAALVAGASLDSLAQGMAQAVVSPWRMEVSRTADGALLINDAYNANPMSMNAAIDALLTVPARRRVAVLGIMAELGSESEAAHVAIGSRLAAEGVEVISVGVEEYSGTLVADPSDAQRALGPLDSDCAVLIKASRVAGLETLAARLMDLRPPGGY